MSKNAVSIRNGMSTYAFKVEVNKMNAAFLPAPDFRPEESLRHTKCKKCRQIFARKIRSFVISKGQIS